MTYNDSTRKRVRLEVRKSRFGPTPIIYELCNLEQVILPAISVLLWQTRNKFESKSQISLCTKWLQTSWHKIMPKYRTCNLGGEKSGWSLLNQGWNQVVDWSVVFCEVSREQSAFKFMWVVGEVQLLAVVGLRSIFSCWLSTSRGCPHSYSICLQSFCDDQIKPVVPIVVRNVAAA